MKTSVILGNRSLFFNMLSSNEVFLLIDKPTRVIGNLFTTIDHILTKDTFNIIHSCIFLSDINDFSSFYLFI